MKKFFITGSVLVAFAAASHAQNTSTVNQNGKSQNASVTQIGNTQNAVVTQSGDLYKSTIQQTSTKLVANQGNYAQTVQQKGSSSEAYINQIGSKSGYVKIEQIAEQNGANTATVNQKNNAGGNGTLPTANATADDVTKAGGNYSSIFQEGSKQQVTVNQNNLSKGNSAITDQANYGSGQKITIDQNDVSSNNKVSVGQAGDGNNASVRQSTNSQSNKAEVVQGLSTKFGGPNSFNATATVEQNGAVGTSSDNKATIKQMGVNSGAVATIRQNAKLFNASRANEASITQTMDGNTGTIDQNDASTSNQATVSQNGTNGSATLSQSNNASDNVATVQQLSGSGLKASVRQSDNASRNTTTTKQYGTNSELSVEQVASSNDNKATINQGAAGTTSSNNKARVYQKEGSQKGEITISQNQTKDGSGNYAQVEQAYLDGTSTANKATIGQEGSRNTTRLSQKGVGNHMAMISQTGNNNSVQGPGTSLYETGPMAVQKGDGNQMTVSQTSPDGTNTTIFNTANLNQDGITNTINLNQTANTVGNMSTISQIGTSNAATVTQVGNGAGVN